MVCCALCPGLHLFRVVWVVSYFWCDKRGIIVEGTSERDEIVRKGGRGGRSKVGFICIFDVLCLCVVCVSCWLFLMMVMMMMVWYCGCFYGILWVNGGAWLLGSEILCVFQVDILGERERE